ncbi:MAG: hypothetical protein V1825_03340 [Candidatus Falkowbacteria bacterium]
MESNASPKSIIEGLKEAGEELNKAPQIEFAMSRKPLSPLKEEAQQINSKVKEENIDLIKKINEHQKEIAREQIALEKTYQEVKELEKNLEMRIMLLKKLQSKSKEFIDELRMAEKENFDILDQAKDKLKSSRLYE